MRQLHTTQRLACHTPHVAPCVRFLARRSHAARSSSNGFRSSVVATVEPSGPTGGPHEIKTQLLSELEGLDRGIFGVPAAKKARILALIAELEKHNTQTAPTANLETVAGDWRLLYSTITITGAKRTKLGLREFVRLGEFTQHIDIANNLAVNRIEFSVSGLSAIRGSLTIRANYQVVSEQRVGITYLDSALTPAGLQKIFEANLDLLLSIFNPEGHLDITYLDLDSDLDLEAEGAASGCWRVGRDNKGNVFLLARPRKH
ncbi:hypothetical protein PLESTB_000454900 [Pleodorina starrii]|uniref:Plastid lipid-associated protein/fibrillin conserved domain-containing protein n=1 Tax=Pleodorina starrii TaxID=330485 RepID=A0A9W6EZF1_9CHLO|nr:hypothetical protein PLESTM_000756400 [Pleodorina starrii]GLC50998.1 hypothetical protein PLESTB_000454900 [Pleodorina starrii]